MVVVPKKEEWPGHEAKEQILLQIIKECFFYKIVMVDEVYYWLRDKEHSQKYQEKIEETSNR